MLKSPLFFDNNDNKGLSRTLCCDKTMSATRISQLQAQQQQQDPIFQQKQAELQLKGQEVQRKAAKDQQEAQMKQAELQLKAQKNQVDALFDAEKLKLDKQELELDAKKEGVRVAANRRQENNKLDLELARMMADKPKRGE